MTEYFIGAIIGVGTMYVIYRLKSNDTDYVKRENDKLNKNLEVQREKRSALERENLKLRDEILDLKRRIDQKEDNWFDLNDSLEDEKRKSTKLNKELEQVSQLLNDYKDALESCQLELKGLKDK